jgi:hypothetical protein
MVGTITKKTMLQHPLTIVQSFGVRVLLSGLIGRDVTFLDLLRRLGKC